MRLWTTQDGSRLISNERDKEMPVQNPITGEEAITLVEKSGTCCQVKKNIRLKPAHRSILLNALTRKLFFASFLFRKLKNIK